MLRITLSAGRTWIRVRNAIFRKFCPLRNPFLWLFNPIGNLGSSDHSVSVSLFTCLYLVLHASSTETKQELVVDFQGMDWHVYMLWGKEATFNETFVVSKQSKFSVTIWGHPKGILTVLLMKG